MLIDNHGDDENADDDDGDDVDFGGDDGGEHDVCFPMMITTLAMMNMAKKTMKSSWPGWEVMIT